MKGTRNLLWLLPGMLVFSAQLWWSPLAGFLRPRATALQDSRPATDITKTFTMEGMTLTQSRGNRLEMRLQSDRVSTGESDEVLHLQTVDAELYGKSGTQVHVESKSGLFETELQQLTLIDDVKLVSDRGHVLHSQKLVYAAIDKELRTDTEVLLTSENMQIKGKGMKYHVESGRMHLGGRVYFEAWQVGLDNP